MANSLGTTNGALIAQRALQTLLAQFPILSQIATDFSDQRARFNQTVNTRVVTAASAGDYDAVAGYAGSDRVSVDVPVVINKHKHHTYSVNDQERTASQIDLIELFAATAAHALGKVMVDDLLAIILAANFPSSSVVGAGTLDRAAVIDIGTKLNTAKVPNLKRFMLLNPAYHGNLFKDATIVSTYANPESDAIASGKLPMVHGFSVSEYSDLPANGELLVGFAGVPEGLVLSTRIPDEPVVGNLPGILTPVTDANTGLTILLREWYDMTLGKEFRSMTLMYGVAVGVAGKIERITSA